MKQIIIIGHENPDTDTVVSAIVLSEIINENQKPIEGQATPKIGAPLNKETELVLNKFNRITPEIAESLKEKDVFLVDHGDFSQSVSGIEEANLIGVLDHHKMGGITTSTPIYYRAEPIGCSSTIIAKMCFQEGIDLTKEQAGLLLSAIISDTLKLTSPTTTKEDEEIVHKLIEISGQNFDELAEAMFEAKADISGISTVELVLKDYKGYEAGGKKFGIGTWETIKPEKIEVLKEEILSVLKRVKEEKGLDLVFFALVDVLKKTTIIFLLDSDKEKLEQIFETRSENNSLVLKGVVSRKKQMVPPIINFLEKK